MNERHIELVMPAGHTLMVHAYGTGKPLVLIHGFPLDAMIWQSCFEPLVRAGYQVFAPDLRGFGQSSSIEAEVTIAQLADDIEQMRQVLITDSIDLAGLSLGGYVAFEYWKRHGKHLRSLILSNTKPQADSEEARLGRLAMADKALAESTWAAVSPMLPKLLSEATRQHEVAITESVQSMMQAVPAKTVAAIQRAMAERHDFAAELANIRVPTLVVAGELDPISTVADNQLWAARIPNSQLEIIPGVGHLPQVEAAEQLTQVMIKFLG